MGSTEASSAGDSDSVKGQSNMYFSERAPSGLHLQEDPSEGREEGCV